MRPGSDRIIALMLLKPASRFESPEQIAYSPQHGNGRTAVAYPSQNRIEAVKEEWRKADWGRGLFDLPPDDRDEFAPLPPSRQ